MLSVGDSCEFCWGNNYSVFTQPLISVVMVFVLFIVNAIKCVCTYIDVKGIIFQSQSCLLGQKNSLFWDMLSTSERVLGPCATQIPSNVNILGFSGDIFLVFSCVG